MDKGKGKKLRRATRQKRAILQSELRGLKKETRALKAVAESLNSEIKTLEDHREYLRKKPMKAYFNEWRRVVIALIFTGFFGTLIGISSARFDAASIIYTIIAGLFATASLAVAFSDKSQTDKSVQGEAGTLRTVFSKDGLNIAGIAISLLALFALISNELFAYPESCGCFGGSGLPYSYK